MTSSDLNISEIEAFHQKIRRLCNTARDVLPQKSREVIGQLQENSDSC
jgi:hypothetical protein